MLGSYPFEADGTEKPIEWIALDVHPDGTALLITRYAIDKAKFHKKQKSVKWRSSSLRSWLNGKFYKKAFSRKERQAIKTSKNKNPANAAYKTAGGFSTHDKVFVLSIDEAEKYFNNDSSRAVYATPYASKNLKFSGTLWHWLRSPGSAPDCAAEVGNLGEVDKVGYFVNRSGMVRPAITVKLDKLP